MNKANQEKFKEILEEELDCWMADAGYEDYVELNELRKYLDQPESRRPEVANKLQALYDVDHKFSCRFYWFGDRFNKLMQRVLFDSDKYTVLPKKSGHLAFVARKELR